jgi:hypothetical protein
MQTDNKLVSKFFANGGEAMSLVMHAEHLNNLENLYATLRS